MRSQRAPSPPLCLCRLRRLLWVDLLAILVESYAGWWCTIPASFSRSNPIRRIHQFPVSLTLVRKEGANVPHNLPMNSTRHTVLQLQIHLRHRILREYRRVRDITCLCPSSAFIIPTTMESYVPQQKAQLRGECCHRRSVGREGAASQTHG